MWLIILELNVFISIMFHHCNPQLALTGNGVLSPMKQLAASTYGSGGQGCVGRGTQGKLGLGGMHTLPTPYGHVDVRGQTGNNHFSQPPVNLQYEQQQLLLAPVTNQEYYEGREQAVNEVSSYSKKSIDLIPTNESSFILRLIETFRVPNSLIFNAFSFFSSPPYKNSTHIPM